MKRVIAVSAALTIAFLVLTLPQKVSAEGKVVCRIQTNSTAATTTTVSDGGTACPWAAGAAVIMQCRDSVVCYTPTGTATVAGSLCAKFTDDADPILIGLNPSEKVISLILKSATDAGTTAYCNFAETRRRIPAP